MIGPTGGYLWGFIIAAYTTGWLAERGWGKTFLTTALAMLVGNIVLYVPGLIVLNLVLDLGLRETLTLGLIPFLIGDTLKLLLATVTIPLGWYFINKKKD